MIKKKINKLRKLIKLNNVSMLERCIELIEKLGVKKILLNTFI